MDMNETDTSTEHVIMSDGLSIDLGEEVFVNQSLLIDDVSLVCVLKRAKMTNQGREVLWEIDLEVPGLGLDDLVNFKKMTFLYNDIEFCSKPGFEFNANDFAGSILTFNAKRINTENE